MLCTITDTIKNALLQVFRLPELVTLFISVLPIVEARGAIPIAFGYGIKPPLALLYAFLGSSLMAPILIAVLIPFVKWLSRTKIFRKVGQTLYEKFEQKSQNILRDKETATADTNAETPNASVTPAEEIAPESKKSDFRKMLGVFAFVAIPLPLTGVWTGSAVAALTKLSYPKALLSVVAGNLVATSILTLLCVLLPQRAIDIVTLVIAGIAIVVVLVLIIKIILHKPKQQEKAPADETAEK